MPKILTKNGRFFKLSLRLGLLSVLASCGSRNLDEEKFSLHLNDDNFDSLTSTLQAYSIKHDYHFSSDTLTGARVKTVPHHIMIEGDSARILVQSALAEKCEEQEGRRDVEYSKSVFDINVFSTSIFLPNANVSSQAKRLKDDLTSAGFSVLSDPESCDFL